MRWPGCWFGRSLAARRSEVLSEWLPMSSRRRYALEPPTAYGGGFANHLATVAAVGATILVMAPLIAIFCYLIYKGASSLNFAFFPQIPKPPGEVGGGMANAIVGSGVLLALASIIGVPLGIGGGIYLAEFGRGTKLAGAIRFTADVLNGVPSIVMGVAVYALIVTPQMPFSALSGGIVLGIMMIPTVCRTTEEMLLMV